MNAGRFAPSPTGPLHLGNLRTAFAAWLSARSRSRDFVVRMEDLDLVTSSRAHEATQLSALAALGLDWDGDVVRQSERFHLYDDAIARLARKGLTYECFCTRREISEAISAPHRSGNDQLQFESGGVAVTSTYPGTCRDLTAAQRRRRTDAGRRPAVRLRTDHELVSIIDERAGESSGRVDDVVLRRNDGVPAYNLAVVIDDALQGIAEVVRGDDLLHMAPTQVMLQRLLGLPTPSYVHIPMVLGPDGTRLAKRHGAVTMDQLAARGIGPGQLVAMLADSLGQPDVAKTATAAEVLARFDRLRIPSQPWVLPADLQRSVS